MRNIFSTTLFAGLIALSACAAEGGDDLSEPAAYSGSAHALSRRAKVSVIKQRIAATNERNWDRWQSLHTVDAIRTAPELEQPLEGSESMRAAIETLGAAFPDYHLELTQAFGEGEWLAVRIHTTGTMTGALVLSDGNEVPATGKSIEQDWSALVRFDGDKISEFHEFYDQLTLMTQLGLIAE